MFDKDLCKKTAVEANQTVWKFLSQRSLSDSEKCDMIAAAFASLYHWDKIGTNLNRARAHWLISRVAVVLEYRDLAIRHALYCAQFTEKDPEAKDFDHAYAAEALARANALNGNLEEAIKLKKRAQVLGANIANAGDKQIYSEDLLSEPWFGVKI